MEAGRCRLPSRLEAWPRTRCRHTARGGRGAHGHASRRATVGYCRLMALLSMRSEIDPERSALLADQLEPFVLGEDGNAEILGLGELRARAGTRNHVVGLLRHRACGLGAEPLGHGLGLVARHLFERAREYDGLAGDD